MSLFLYLPPLTCGVSGSSCKGVVAPGLTDSDSMDMFVSRIVVIAAKEKCDLSGRRVAVASYDYEEHSSDEVL